MALSSEFPDDGLAVFDRWSSGGKTYDRADLKSRWRSWSRKRGKTVATLFHIAKRYGYRPGAALSTPEQQAERERERAERERRRQAADAQDARRAMEAAQDAQVLWDRAPPEPPHDHAYALRKCIPAEGVRLYRGQRIIAGMPCDGCLIVPLRDIAGRLVTLEFIAPNGDKKCLPGGKMFGAFFTPHGLPEAPEELYITEGFATCQTVARASGKPTVAAYSAGNLKAVALALRGRYPSARLIVAADNDAFTSGNPGLAKARAAAEAVGGEVRYPVFRDTSAEPTDFNDLQCQGDIEEVRRQLQEPHPAEDALLTALEAAPGLQEPHPPESPSPPTEPGPTDARQRIIDRLARLHPFDYDQVRKDKAKALGIRPETLDKAVNGARAALSGGAQDTQGRKMELYEPEPWPSPVDGVEVLDEIFFAIRRHMAIREEYAITATLWAAHVHVFDVFAHTPRLAITAPDAECGKTLLLSHLVGAVVTRPFPVELMTTATFFRLAEKFRPCFLIDEVDVFVQGEDRRDLVGALNGGFEPQGGVPRCVPPDYDVRFFPTHAPVAMGGINLPKHLPPATLSRCCLVTLERAVENEIPEIYDRDKHREGLLKLGRLLARCCRDNRDALRRTEPCLPPGARNRQADKWRPLFAIAQRAGGDWPERVNRAYLIDDRDGTAKLSTALQLLADIREVLNPSEEKIFTVDLIDRLCALDESPWAEYNFRVHDEERRKIQDRQISKLLRDYRVEPGTVRFGTKTSKGYKRMDLEIAWKRYLPSQAAPQASHPAPPGPDHDDVLI